MLATFPAASQAIDAALRRAVAARARKRSARQKPSANASSAALISVDASGSLVTVMFFYAASDRRLLQWLARELLDPLVDKRLRFFRGPLAPAPCASVTQHRTCDWCASEADCELKVVWVQVRDAVAQVMDAISLGALIRQAVRSPRADRYAI